MFLKLFFALKAAKVPVSLREHMTLIEAMDAGLAIYDVDEFYYLARAALVKDERHLDRLSVADETRAQGLGRLGNGAGRRRGKRTRFGGHFGSHDSHLAA